MSDLVIPAFFVLATALTATTYWQKSTTGLIVLIILWATPITLMIFPFAPDETLQNIVSFIAYYFAAISGISHFLIAAYISKSNLFKGEFLYDEFEEYKKNNLTMKYLIWGLDFILALSLIVVVWAKYYLA